jgi:hypothetical protein
LSVSPTLLRRRRRRAFRRLVFVGAITLSALLGAGSAAAVPPTITVTITGTPGLNDWYRSNVTVKWTVQGEDSSSGCDTVTLTADTPGTTLTCTARSGIFSSSQNATIKLDKTAPATGTAIERPPDAGGWYNRPVSVTFTGVDVTSGIAACSSARYVGPDNSQAFVSGSCTDNAGNATAIGASFKYDATPPAIAAFTTTLGNRSVQLAWRASSDTNVVEILRAPGRNGVGESVVYRGAASGYRDTGLVVGRKYEYRLSGWDEAGNRIEHTANIVATGALLKPAPAERVTSPPKLVWTPRKGATYYNVQIFRGRKVLSAWPARPSFQLRRTWLYNGRRYRLRPGVYRWYVWPGYGRISAGRYGREPLGSSTFVVPK